MIIHYPDDKMRSVAECRHNGRKIREALSWFGLSPRNTDVDITENGSAFVGCTEILPPLSIETF